MTTPDELRSSALAEVRTLLLDHAIRCFDAEVAVELRIANRRNLVLTAILAAIGLGILRIGWLDAPTDLVRSHATGSLFQALLLGAVLFLGRALLLLLALPPEPQLSDGVPRLRLHAERRSLLKLPGLGAAWEDVFRATYGAFVRIQKRNAAERAALDRAQKSLVTALLLLFLATLGSHFAKLWT